MKKAELEKLFKKFSPEIRKAFLAAIRDLDSGVDLKALRAAIKAQDIQGTLAAMNLDQAAFEPLQSAIERAYATSATAAAATTPPIRTQAGVRAILRFDVRDLAAENQIRRYSSTAVKEISDKTRDAIRIALEDSFIKGDNPTTIASRLVGVYDKTLKRRTGGVLGLTGNQEQTVKRAMLDLANNPKAFLKRALRDKRTDRAIQRAINDKKPVPKEIQDKAIARLRDNMMTERAKTIGRTEALTTLHMGQRATYQQALDKGLLSQEDIEREWSATGDNHTRETHIELDGQMVGWDEAYVVPSTGARLMYPGDPAAPAEEVINCRCWEITRIKYLKRFQ